MMTNQDYLAIVILSIMRELRRQGHDDIVYKYAEDRMGFSVEDVDRDIPAPTKVGWIPRRIGGSCSMDFALGLYAAHNSVGVLKKYVESEVPKRTEQQVAIKVEEIANVIDKYFDYRMVKVHIIPTKENPNTIRI